MPRSACSGWSSQTRGNASTLQRTLALAVLGAAISGWYTTLTPATAPPMRVAELSGDVCANLDAAQQCVGGMLDVIPSLELSAENEIDITDRHTTGERALSQAIAESAAEVTERAADRKWRLHWHLAEAQRLNRHRLKEAKDASAQVLEEQLEPVLEADHAAAVNSEMVSALESSAYDYHIGLLSALLPTARLDWGLLLMALVATFWYMLRWTSAKSRAAISMDKPVYTVEIVRTQLNAFRVKQPCSPTTQWSPIAKWFSPPAQQSSLLEESPQSSSGRCPPVPSHGGNAGILPQLWGMTKSQLLLFVEACRTAQGWKQLEQSTERKEAGYVNGYQIDTEFVQPWTKGTGCSVSLLMNSKPLQADIMISHGQLRSDLIKLPVSAVVGSVGRRH